MVDRESNLLSEFTSGNGADTQHLIMAKHLNVNTNTSDSASVPLGDSTWQLTEIDGIAMIEVSLPAEVRNHFDLRGVRLVETETGHDTAYNPIAFEVLKATGERLVQQHYSPE